MKMAMSLLKIFKTLCLPTSIVKDSFDMESLFTSMSLLETINIAIHFLLKQCNDAKRPRKLFRSTLDISVTNSCITFNQNLFKQPGGFGMGLPNPRFNSHKHFLCKAQITKVLENRAFADASSTSHYSFIFMRRFFLTQQFLTIRNYSA